jgi:hypothetical protein
MTARLGTFNDGNLETKTTYLNQKGKAFGIIN